MQSSRYSPESDDSAASTARDPAGHAPAGAPSGVVWTAQGPMLRFENAVVEEVVTRVKRTTTTFAPIALPRVAEPDHIAVPAHLSAESYPLAHEPTPDDMRFFTFELDNRRVYVQDEGVDLSKGIPGQTRGPGWTRELPVLGDDCRQVSLGGVLASGVSRQGGKDLDKGKGKERKRPHEVSRPPTSTGNRRRAGAQDDEVTTTTVMRGRSPPRKKVRSQIGGISEDLELLGSTPPASNPGSPNARGDDAAIVASQHPSMASGLEATALLSLPAMVEHFDKLPDKIQQHVLMHMLRRSRMPTIQRITSFCSTALRRDFIDLLPHEVAVQILNKCDLKSLVAGMRVSKRWRRMIDTERSVWRTRIIEGGFTIGHGVEEEEEKSIRSRWEIIDHQQRRRTHGRRLIKAGTPSEDERMSDEAALEAVPVQAPEDRPSPVKHIFRRRYTSCRNWLEREPKHTTFPGHGLSVVTCVQFDDDKIVSASDDHTINIYDTKTGQLRKRLDGHEGGVWALEYKGDTLVSGSTDRTVRIWDIKKLKPTHVFTGHTSTVRCLQIVEPVYEPATGEFQPAYPLIVTGSRDASLRVWRMPKSGETNLPPPEDGHHPTPESNPYHLQHLAGHTEAVRALAVHGRTCISGSYDKTVRVWDIVKGTCTHVLHGHEHKVYSISYDRLRNRCASGAMDNTVKVWDVETGTCLHTLSGHTSLVGLLSSSPNFIVSAAADATVRVWDAETCEIKHSLTGHAAPITCFQHDEFKVVSGCDGTLKLWDIRTGRPVRDLIVGISSVWQVAFNDNLLVAASNRNGSTVFDVFDFGSQPDPYGVDDARLDTCKRKPWERPNPHEPQTYQSDGDCELELLADDTDQSDVLSPTTTERWRAMTVDAGASASAGSTSNRPSTRSTRRAAAVLADAEAADDPVPRRQHRVATGLSSRRLFGARSASARSTAASASASTPGSSSVAGAAASGSRANARASSSRVSVVVLDGDEADEDDDIVEVDENGMEIDADECDESLEL